MRPYEEFECRDRSAVRRPSGRGATRAILILALEALAVGSFVLHDVGLAALLQLLAMLVVHVDRLDRRLPDARDRRLGPRLAVDEPPLRDPRPGP